MLFDRFDSRPINIEGLLEEVFMRVELKPLSVSVKVEVAFAREMYNYRLDGVKGP
jgi:hypothetical protein